MVEDLLKPLQDIKQILQVADLDQDAKSLGQVKYKTSSELQADYLRIMNVEDPSQFRSRRLALLIALESSGLAHKKDSPASMRITLIEFTSNYEYFALDVSYNGFLFHISVLNVNESSPCHKIEKLHKGNFSCVYHAVISSKNIGVKCNIYKANNFACVFKYTLLEYLAFDVASRLQSGPCMPKPFGFDLLVFDDCIEFSMEFCRQQLLPEPALKNNLFEALRNLHSLKIVHCDIKPDNICFSEEYGKYVFIDMGLHLAISEEVGFKTDVGFRGSLQFCSKQMWESFLKGRSEVDLYFNDALCLQKSIEQVLLEKQKRVFVKEKTPKTFEEPMLLTLVKMKFILTHLNQFHQSSLQYNLYSKVTLLKAPYFQSIQAFIASLNYSSSFEDVIKNLEKYCSELFILQIAQTKLKKLFKFDDNEEEHLNNFKKKVSVLQSLNYTGDNEYQNLKMGNKTDDCIAFLCNEEKVKLLDKRQYFQFAAETIQVNCWKVSIANKNRILTAFNEIYISSADFGSASFEQKTITCYRHICGYLQAQLTLDFSLYQTVRHSLLSVILLQIYPEHQLISLVQKMMEICKQVKRLVRLFVHVLSCIQWILHIYSSKYCYYKIKNELFKTMNLKLAKLPEQQSALKQIISVLLQPSDNLVKHRKIYNQILYFKDKLHSHIYKFFSSTNQTEQIFAQIYVYLLYFAQKHMNIFSQLSKVQSLVDGLLVLHFYQKQKNLCIFSYYQFAIISFVCQNFDFEQVIHKDLIELCKHFTSFYSSIFDNTQQVFEKMKVCEVRDWRIYCKDIKLDGFNKIGAVYQQRQLYELLELELSTLNQQKIDKATLSRNLNLDYVYQIIPYLQQIAAYEAIHDHDIINIFNVISSIINHHMAFQKLYLSQQVNINSYSRINSLIEHLLRNISCLYCKAKCYIAYFLQNNFKVYGLRDKAELQAFQLAWWMLKQPLERANGLKIMKLLCFQSNKYQYGKLYIELLIANDMPLLFLPQQQYIFNSKKIHINILNVLWRERQEHVYEEKPLYFVFIIRLCQQFTTTNVKWVHRVNFIELVWQFVNSKRQCSRQFLQFNIQFLLNNSAQLEKEWYCALYLGIILNPSKLSYGQPFISNKYYNFVWKYCHRFDAFSRQAINVCVYKSFLCNEMKNKPPNRAKWRHLLRIQFKNGGNRKDQQYELVRIMKDQLCIFKRKVKGCIEKYTPIVEAVIKFLGFCAHFDMPSY